MKTYPERHPDPVRRAALLGVGATLCTVGGVVAGCGGDETSAEPAVAAAPAPTAAPVPGAVPTNTAPYPALPAAEPETVRAVRVATGLASPWAFAFLPDGRALVTEKGGAMRIVDPASGAISAPLAGVPAVASSGQGGLLDVVLGPTFASDAAIYFTFSEPAGGGTARTAVARAVLGAAALSDVTVLYRQTPAVTSTIHFGARLVFDRAGYLFVTLGERGDGAQAPRVDNSRGKVVRIRPDGSIPADNPAAAPDGADTGRASDAGPAHPAFRQPGALPELWSIGHRNPQGAALHPVTGELWISEHGPRGGDEINRVRRGRDYGWPRIGYARDYGTGEPLGEGTTAPDVEPPLAHWAPVSAAPAGILFYTGDRLPEGWKGSLLVGTLAARVLVRYTLEDPVHVARPGIVAGTTHLSALGERIRDLRQGPDGFPYFVTDGGGLYRLQPG